MPQHESGDRRNQGTTARLLLRAGEQQGAEQQFLAERRRNDGDQRKQEQASKIVGQPNPKKAAKEPAADKERYEPNKFARGVRPSAEIWRRQERVSHPSD